MIYQELFTHDSEINAQINATIKEQRSPHYEEIINFITLDESAIGPLDFMDIILNLVYISISNN